MISKHLGSLILVIGLVGCNLPGVSGGGASTESTGDGQIVNPPDQSTGEDPSAAGAIGPIQESSTQIEGVPYRAYQIPGDPFRFVCQEPCPLDQQFIEAEYAGFRRAHAMLIELLGVDTLTELQPVDMHLVLQDSICADYPWGHASIYSSTHQAYTCTEGPGRYPTIEEMIQRAAQSDDQYFPLHEYMHTIFFGRLSGKAGDFEDIRAWYFHDYVVEVPSFALGISDPAGFCFDRGELVPGDFGGALIFELCQRNGFQLTDLSPSLIELDRLYETGAGLDQQEGFEHPSPSVTQYRDILNQLLGGDTTAAFAAACWPPELFGGSFISPAACVPALPEGTATPSH